jgi:hypothetical protein
MYVIGPNQYHEFKNPEQLPIEFILGDHIGGFDSDLTNVFYDILNNYAKSVNKFYTIHNDIIYSTAIKDHYNHINFVFSVDIFNKYSSWKQFSTYVTHPDINYKNFICSFNGKPHVSRKLLVAILQKFNYFNLEYCSKNFCYSEDTLSGHIKDYTDIQERLYNKFFVSKDSNIFSQSINSFGFIEYDHKQNIHNLESKLTKSFLHIVSETMATSYYPYITEKFLYSIVTRGLFLAYGQPSWHSYLEEYYGFKRYTKLFDYTFDDIQNPIKRLVELINMVSKFSHLTTDEWKDLYQFESDTIEYNYDHYHSKNYINHFKNYEHTTNISQRM